MSSSEFANPSGSSEFSRSENVRMDGKTTRWVSENDQVGEGKRPAGWGNIQMGYQEYPAGWGNIRLDMHP